MIPNQFYTFHYSQVPGFEKLYELSRQHSYAPVTFDPLCFHKLAPGSSLYARRAAMNDPPAEEAILQSEYELSLKKKGSGALGERPPRDVESSDHSQILSRLSPYRFDAAVSSGSHDPAGVPHRDVKHRIASGYVKLDDRRARLGELIAAVDEFFDAHCHCQGDYYYPMGGFRDWHTNKYDTSGWRLYVIDVDVPRRSFFRIKHPSTNELITVWDAPGTFNFFLIDPNRLLWHCIGAEQANRWSKGFVIPDTWLDSVVARIDGTTSASPPSLTP